jgi:hypothetical protein
MSFHFLFHHYIYVCTFLCMELCSQFKYIIFVKISQNVNFCSWKNICKHCHFDIILTTLKIGSTHPIWTSLSSTVSSIKKGNIKARLLTGTYLLEINKHKFSSRKESPLCKCCGTENEDVTHFLLHVLCPALYKQIKESFPRIKAFMISLIGMAKWTSNFNEKSAIVRLIIDSTFALLMIKNRSDLEGLHRLSADMCYKLHAQRTWLLQKIKLQGQCGNCHVWPHIIT